MANIVELHEMDREDLEKMLENAYEEMFNLRFQRATGRLENTARLREVRRELAQLKTVLHGRDLAIAYAVEMPAIAEALAGKTWTAEAHYDYEEGAHVVEFADEDGNELAKAFVNISAKRRGARKARREKPMPQRVIRYEVG